MSLGDICGMYVGDICGMSLGDICRLNVPYHDLSAYKYVDYRVKANQNHYN
jgi:hypothetical protein